MATIYVWISKTLSPDDQSQVRFGLAGGEGGGGKWSGRGFTLIELLVVLAIIVVLMAVLLPSLSGARNQAILTRCKAQIRGQLQAHAAYAAEFNDAKAPLFRQTTASVRVDWVSPDVKWSNTTVGQGLLVSWGYLKTFEALLDPSPTLREDVERDRVYWQTMSSSGSSYAYYFREALEAGVLPADACQGVTYAAARNNGKPALIMDLNAEAGHPYVGEYAGRTWLNHPGINRINIGYVDGSVRDFPAADVQLKYPGGSYEELVWFKEAHKRY